MRPTDLCIAVGSSACDLSFLSGADTTVVQVGDLCVPGDVSNYAQRIARQLQEIASYGMRTALLLPLAPPDGDRAALESIVTAACGAGVSEIVANSLGEIRTVRELHADLVLTASDFVCCYCVQDAFALRDYGVSRVRLSPEMDFAQVSALASKAPIGLQVIAFGRVTLGVLQDFSRLQACAGSDARVTVCAETGGEALFQLHGAEVVSARVLNLLDQIPTLRDAGISSFFVDARFLDRDNITQVYKAYHGSLMESTHTSDDLSLIGLKRDSDKPPLGIAFCNGWFYNKPGIGDLP